MIVKWQRSRLVRVLEEWEADVPADKVGLAVADDPMVFDLGDLDQLITDTGRCLSSTIDQDPHSVYDDALTYGFIQDTR